MSGNDAKVLLDLNAPQFQSGLFDLDPSEVKKVLKTLKKLRGLTWNEIFRDRGLNWEEVKSMPGKYTIRLSQSYRAVAAREGGWMRFAALHQDHDGAYGKK
jgi:hypothetical protein